MRLTLSRKVLLLLGVPLVFQVALLGLLAWTNRAHTAAQEGTIRSKDATTEADRVLRFTLDAETGIRGYVLTADPEFTEPFATATFKLSGATERLRELTNEFSDQRDRADAIADAADRTLIWLRQTADMVRAGEMAVAEQRVRSKDGKQLMDELRDRIAEFHAIEDSLSAERIRRSENARKWVAGLWIGGTIATVLLTGLMATYFWRRVGRRLTVMSENFRRLAAGQDLLNPLPGRDELTALDQAFRQMARQLTHAVEEVRQTAEQVRSLYNEAPCGYHSIDHNATITSINDTELHWLGYRRHEVVGRMRLDEMMTESSRQRFAEVFPRFKETGLARDVEYEFLRKDGVVLAALVNSLAVYDQSGRYTSSRASVVDITARKQAEAAVLLFAQVVHNIPIGVIVYQVEGDNRQSLALRSANSAASRLLGVSLQTAIGRNIADVFPALPEAMVRQFVAVAENGEGLDVGEIVDGDSRVKERWWSVLAFPLPDRCVGVAFQDVSERKRIEAEIRRLNEGLEAAVRARTAELAESNRDLVQKNAENEMFVYSVSHDLRSPLVNLQGFSKELSKGCEKLASLLADERVPGEIRQAMTPLLSGKMARSLEFIQAAVLRLGNIIDALLRLSRAGRVEYRLQEVDVQRTVARIVAAAQATIAEKKATVVVGALPAAWGDATAIEQVFGNLLGNALTYLDPVRPGQIEIGVHEPGAADEPSGFATYFVRDNGLGIPSAHHQKIFQVFQRVHPGVGAGEGMGLAIVARVVERHRGRVWVESVEGNGSAFFVRLPRPPPGKRPPLET
jgi:PAS domain S-box-containing protein